MKSSSCVNCGGSFQKGKKKLAPPSRFPIPLHNSFSLFPSLQPHLLALQKLFSSLPAEMSLALRSTSRIAGARVAAKPSTAARRPARAGAVKALAFKVTLKTPSGDQVIECAGE